MLDRNLPETGELTQPVEVPAMPLRGVVLPPNTQKKKPWRLLMQISGESHTTIGLEVKDTILIGRRASDNNPLDIDLSDYGGEQHGVSRRHTRIINANNVLYVEDLNSTNGTRLNGYGLQTGQRYRLRDGDALNLGTLRIVVRFVKSPVR